MKKYFIIFILTSFILNSFGQEKGNIRPFINPAETKARFIEDKNLSENENLKSFRKKIKEHFIKHLENTSVKDSIKDKIFVSFKIDTVGVSIFHNLKPQKLETIYLKVVFSNIINSFPKFIPATQRNKKVPIYYTFIYKNK